MLWLALAAALAAWPASSQSAGEPVTVSAAVSLTEVMEELGRAYSQAGGNRPVFNFGASNVLARQIVNGAPVDVFISADDAQMAVVERAGLLSPGTRVPLLSNQLAIVVRQDWTGELTSAASLSSPAIRRIAVGDTEAVPAGVYARQYLERIGLWQRLQPKLIPSASVRAALAAVSHGAADAAIVYVTDARASENIRVAAIIAGKDAPGIVYPACVVRTSRKQNAAQAFLAFLATPAAQQMFRKHGFVPLGKTGMSGQ